jgi:hypothetical protein
VPRKAGNGKLNTHTLAVGAFREGALLLDSAPFQVTLLVVVYDPEHRLSGSSWVVYAGEGEMLHEFQKP